MKILEDAFPSQLLSAVRILHCLQTLKLNEIPGSQFNSLTKWEFRWFLNVILESLSDAVKFYYVLVPGSFIWAITKWPGRLIKSLIIDSDTFECINKKLWMFLNFWNLLSFLKIVFCIEVSILPDISHSVTADSDFAWLYWATKVTHGPVADQKQILEFLLQRAVILN